MKGPLSVPSGVRPFVRGLRPKDPLHGGSPFLCNAYRCLSPTLQFLYCRLSSTLQFLYCRLSFTLQFLHCRLSFILQFLSTHPATVPAHPAHHALLVQRQLAYRATTLPPPSPNHPFLSLFPPRAPPHHARVVQRQLVHRARQSLKLLAIHWVHACKHHGLGRTEARQRLRHALVARSEQRVANVHRAQCGGVACGVWVTAVPQSDDWLGAGTEEMASLVADATLEWAKRPQDAHLRGGRWVYER
eukprot:352414-Chlamydomonas_euryale.AAC.3